MLATTRRLIAGGGRRRSLPAVRPTCGDALSREQGSPTHVPPAATRARPLSTERSGRRAARGGSGGGYRSLLDDADEAMRRDSPAEYERYLRGRDEYRRRRGGRGEGVASARAAGGESRGRRSERTESGPVAAVDGGESDDRGGVPRSTSRDGRRGRRGGESDDGDGGRSGGGFRGPVRGGEEPDGPDPETVLEWRRRKRELRSGRDARHGRRGDATSGEAGGSGAGGGDGGEGGGRAGLRPSGDESPPEPERPVSRGILGGAAPSSRGTGGEGIMSSISRSVKSGSTGRVSLEELFPTLYGRGARAPEAPSPPPDPRLAYDPEHFRTYKDAVDAVVEDKNVVRHWGRLEKEVGGGKGAAIVELVKDWLADETRVVDPDDVDEVWGRLDETWGETGITGRIAGSGGEESEFDAELRAQRERFLSRLVERRNERLKPDDDGGDDEDGGAAGLTADDLNPAFFRFANHILGALGRYCANRARSSPMEVAWPKVRESGILLPEPVISNYLYVVSAMTVSNAFISSADRGGSARDRFRIPGEVATYHDLASRPTESSISLRIKGLADKGDARTAEEYLESFKRSLAAREATEGKDEGESGSGGDGSKEMVRLRTYLPILKLHCDNGDASSALSTYRSMQATDGVFFEPEAYVMVLSCLAQHGYLHEDSDPIEGATTRLGFANACGPGLFDEVCGEMAADCLEITSASARRLSNAFAGGFAGYRPRGGGDGEGSEDGEDSDEPSRTAVVSRIEEANPLKDMPLSRRNAPPNEVVACRVNLDRSTGVCPVTSAVQRLILLGPDERSRLHDDLLDLSAVQYTAFTRDGRKQRGRREEEEDRGQYAKDELTSFSDWLAQRTGRPFTAIIDGANVGYYMQSFDKGRFNYHQINYMVKTLIDRGENPLVIVPGKYGKATFHSSHGNVQRLDREEVSIMRGLFKEGRLYGVPAQCLDDFYWMLASVSDQPSSARGRDGPDELAFVPGEDPRGRFPGTRPMLLTNDQMRDHNFYLLEPRLFRRWYGCHIVNYSFTAFVLGESVAGNEIVFSQADYFSREIQGNDPSGENDGGGEEEGESAAWGGRAWHFPVSDWDLDERFVVRIPARRGR